MSSNDTKSNKFVNLIYNGNKAKFLINTSPIELLQAVTSFFYLESSSPVEKIFVFDGTKIVPLLPKNLIENSNYTIIVKNKFCLKKGNCDNNNNINKNIIENNQKRQNNDVWCDMQNSEYFSNYGKIGVHKTMLQDKTRTLIYKKAFEANSNLIKDKIILDVGSGTGILSLFAAKLGAQKVISSDASSIVNYAEKIITLNHYLEKINIYKGVIEESDIEPVDLIVSEWMGSMLLFESMLDSIIYARDNFLKPNGKILPSYCKLLIAPIQSKKLIDSHINFWDDVYGIDMSCLKEKAQKEFFNQAIFDRYIDPEELMAKGTSFFEFDMLNVTINETKNVLGKFSVKLEKEGVLHGFGCWFDVNFFDDLVLSTSPCSEKTHWKQTTLIFDNFPEVEKGQVIEGIISLNRNVYWGRHYDIIVKYWVTGSKVYFQKKFSAS